MAQETTMDRGHSVIQRAGMAVRGDVVVTLPQQYPDSLDSHSIPGDRLPKRRLTLLEPAPLLPGQHDDRRHHVRAYGKQVPCLCHGILQAPITLLNHDQEIEV